MIRVNQSDINLQLVKKLIDGSDNYIIKFYTIDSNFSIVKGKDDVTVNCGEYYLPLEWAQLMNLNEGVLQARYYYYIEDEDFLDSEHNKFKEYTTNYYIQSGVNLDPSSASTYADIIVNGINDERQRATQAESNLLLLINDEVEARRQNVSALTALIDAITDTSDLSGFYTKAETDELITNAVANEATARLNADNEIGVRIDTLNSQKLDASAYTPTDLSDYYTKAEIEGKGYLTSHQDISGLATKDELINKLDASAYTETDLSNYYTKDEVSEQMNGKLDASAYTETDLSEYYTKAQINEIVDNIEAGDYDLADYYTKAEVDSLIGFDGDIVCGDFD